MDRSDLLHVLSALEDSITEFEELMKEKEWYVTAVTDKLFSAQQIITEEIANAEFRSKDKAVPRPKDHGDI